ncbi:MAG: biopolymer transporter ExbD [Roseobacter sp.]|jgi:biopolymer transport protein ExbD|nr:biopolymer transporter ExbD [Roseobacter sp.]
MMDFSPTSHPRTRTEAIVPMINVVFLLLIFFLMSAQFVPPDPFDATPPESASAGDRQARDTLYIGDDGALWFEGAEGDSVWALIAARDTATPLRLKADARLQASVLAGLLPRLTTAGQTDTLLIVGGK